MSLRDSAWLVAGSSCLPSCCSRRCRSLPAATTSRSRINMLQLHGAGHRLGAVLRADALHLARHRRVLRHRRLHGRGARRTAAVAAGAARRGRGRRSRWRWSSAFRRCGCPASTSSSSRFGLAELVRQLVTWYEVNVHRSVGRYMFLDITAARDLLAAAGARRCWCSLIGWLIGRSRLGLALRVIGDDETRRAPLPASTPRAPSSRCSRSAPPSWRVTGAIMAPRWTYIDPAIAFNPMISFQVVIMALLGGAGALLRPAARRRAAGAAVRGAVGELSRTTSASCSALVFIVIVYFLPQRRHRACAQSGWPARCGRRRRRTATRRHRIARLSTAVRKSFGGLRRGRRSRRSRRARRDRRPDRTERLRQDDGAQPDLRRARAATPGEIRFKGRRSRG